MGYELNIIRKSNWDDHEEPSNISLDEWLSYASSDPELQRNQKEGEGWFDWIAYPDPDPIGLPWFDYYKGFISTKNPNFWVIQKLLAIAGALNAKVFGEEGEEYDQNFLDSIS
jgi:hypothetical protein